MPVKRIFLTEDQVIYIKKAYAVDPKKVLFIKKYLDKHFIKASIGNMASNGEWKETPIVAIVDNNRKPIRNMNATQMFHFLQSKFNGEEGHIYADKERADKLIKTVIKAWYNDDITKEGLIKNINHY